MNLLLTIDKKNYTDDMPLTERFGVRAIILKNGKLAMQHSKYGEYKIPGGGTEKGETMTDALIREVMEETGLEVIVESIKPIGEILEIREDLHKKGCKFLQHSYYFFCDVTDNVHPLSLTESEIARGYTLEYATPEEIYKNNAALPEEPWIIRDNAFIKMLIDGTIKK